MLLASVGMSRGCSTRLIGLKGWAYRLIKGWGISLSHSLRAMLLASVGMSGGCSIGLIGLKGWAYRLIKGWGIAVACNYSLVVYVLR